MKFLTENHVFSSPAVSDLQAMNYEVYKNMKLTLNINFTLAFASILSIVSIISSVSFSSLSNLSSKVFWEIVNLLMTSALSLDTPLKVGQFINEVYILGQNVSQNKFISSYYLVHQMEHPIFESKNSWKFYHLFWSAHRCFFFW